MAQNIDEPRGLWFLPVVGRVILACVFSIGLFFKLISPTSTAHYIAAAGFPAAGVLTWLAVLLEIVIIFDLLTGTYFKQTCLVAAAYVLFLGFAFHGPSHWTGNQMEFGAFVDHFVFVAALFFASAHGPGRWTVGRSPGPRVATS